MRGSARIPKEEALDGLLLRMEFPNKKAESAYKLKQVLGSYGIDVSLGPTESIPKGNSTQTIFYSHPNYIGAALRLRDLLNEDCPDMNISCNFKEVENDDLIGGSVKMKICLE